MTTTPERTLRPPQAKQRRGSAGPLGVGDTIEYSITMEVSPGPGQKAWVKFGTSASVQEGESTRDAVARIAGFVESTLDQRLDELGD